MATKKVNKQNKSKGKTTDLIKKQAQANKAKEQSKPITPVVSNFVTDEDAKSKPVFQVPNVIHNQDTVKTKEKTSSAVPKTKKPDFDIEEVTSQIRSGAGLMHIKSAMYAYLQGRGNIVVDRMEGIIHVCHVEVDGWRIPADKDDFFKY